MDGELQSSKPPPSSRQLKLAPDSFEAKLNDGLRSGEVEPFAGPEEIVTFGAWVSTVNDRDDDLAHVSGGVDRLDEEGVGAVRERRGRVGRAAGLEGACVDPALEGRAGLVRGEARSAGLGRW